MSTLSLVEPSDVWEATEKVVANTSAELSGATASALPIICFRSITPMSHIFDLGSQPYHENVHWRKHGAITTLKNL